MPPRSQHQSDQTAPVDALPPLKALDAMLAGHLGAAQAVATALPQIDAAARLVAQTIRQGGTLHYAAAGSSGLMALADGCELPGTFRIPQEQIRIAMAGGVPADGRMPGDTEDDTVAATAVAAAFGAGDIAIVLSASGTTPYACAIAEQVRAKGNKVIAIANVAGSALLSHAEIAIAIPTPPEVVSGSTRLGAGTAQKIALNMISTMAGVYLGHVHDGLMVNLHPDNAKLRDRAKSIVMQIAGVSEEAAVTALADARNDTKNATLIALGATPEHARALLAKNDHRLAPCLAALRNDRSASH